MRWGFSDFHTGPALIGSAEALQSSDIDGGESESAMLSRVLGGYEVGAMLNNGNVLKALLAGLPFWGVRDAATLRPLTRGLAG